MNIDHCNSHSSFKDKVSMSNLCQEITLPTVPVQHIDDDQGEIALCILSAINVGSLKDVSELENLCDISVRALDQIIDYQDYPVKAAEVSTKARRSLGIGYIGLAHSWLKILKVSHEKLNTNKPFFEDKINTATYYFDKILPRVQSHYLSAVTGSETLMKTNFN